MFTRIVLGTRYIILLPVIGSLILSIITLIYGVLAGVVFALHEFTHVDLTASGSKFLAVEDIQLIDIFLLGTVLYIIALGLYDLFIDAHLALPSWLVLRSFEDLKSKLIGIIIVLLAVTFLAAVVNWNGKTDIFSLGIGTSLALLALSVVNWQTRKRQNSTDDSSKPEDNGA
ncbi:YqhA family protein [Dictyobacter arantiisoli]|uniref:YqhA family protein n=1 Tax=Dictyobacter arantiisoli TaxID=2014874 RepID=A0A5A5TLG8_9CHLR|nr:YqhA family protein [Dictyobacter arantiisoli]GCF11999.1 hypothetical protein KDI_55630 [Dictyobacter arantiisoli]